MEGAGAVVVELGEQFGELLDFGVAEEALRHAGLVIVIN